MSMVSVCLPSDALLQHLPSYLGFSYLGCGESLPGCSSKAQPLLLTLDEGYLLTATPPDLERGFLTCIQVSQEAGQVVWYSHLLQNFPQFIVIHTVKGFGLVNKAEVDVFLELSCFFNGPADVTYWPGAFLFQYPIILPWKKSYDPPR